MRLMVTYKREQPGGPQAHALTQGERRTQSVGQNHCPDLATKTILDNVTLHHEVLVRSGYLFKE